MTFFRRNKLVNILSDLFFTICAPRPFGRLFRMNMNVLVRCVVVVVIFGVFSISGCRLAPSGHTEEFWTDVRISEYLDPIGSLLFNAIFSEMTVAKDIRVLNADAFNFPGGTQSIGFSVQNGQIIVFQGVDILVENKNQIDLQKISSFLMFDDYYRSSFDVEVIDLKEMDQMRRDVYRIPSENYAYVLTYKWSVPLPK